MGVNDPFIVTTKRPEGYYTDLPPKIASRRAVATLEDRKQPNGEIEKGARTVVHDIVAAADCNGEWSSADYRFYQQARSITESGGTVGPLPDGTVIEVEPTTWKALTPDPGWGFTVARAEAGDAKAQQAILDAYNARQS